MSDPIPPVSNAHRSYTSVFDEHRQQLREARFAAAYDGGDFGAWQVRARAALARLVGFSPLRQTALTGERVWQRDHRLGRIEKWRIRGEDRAEVPIYWCVPAKPHPAKPTMICLQGHTSGMHCSIGVSQADPWMDQPVEGDRDFALQCMSRGAAALCVEQRGFGERRDKAERTTDCQHMAMRALLLGRTLVAERVADVELARRWAFEWQGIDPGRVGIMGNSAGGTTAFFAAALLGGFHLLVPSCSFGLLRDTWFGGSRCVCGYVPNMLNVMDLPDVLALHAPRPAIVVGGEHDYHAPAAQLREAFAQLQRRYAAAGNLGGCRLLIGPGGHRFYSELAWPHILEQW